MPSYSTGFWVAATRNGRGSGRETPSTETWPSSIASSSADWVLGGVRLISSASSRLVKIGPSRKLSSPCRLSITIEPVMSPGIRSGVNCTRRVSTDSAPARVRTSSVLATPGTPSISTWPPHSSATSRPETAASWPTTALATSVRTAASRSRASSSGRRVGGLAHGRRTSLSSSASWSARVIRSWSVAGRRRAGPSRASISATGRPVWRATSRTRVVGVGARAEAQPLGGAHPGGRAQRRRRRAPGRRPCGRAGPGSGWSRSP